MKYILFLFGLALILPACQKENVSEEDECIPRIARQVLFDLF